MIHTVPNLARIVSGNVVLPGSLEATCEPANSRNANAAPFISTVLLRALMVLLTGFSLPNLSLAQSGPDVRGQVTDVVTRFGVEGVKLTLDISPGDGTPEVTSDSDLFGFFDASPVPAGSYRLRAVHPGYQPLETNVVVIAGAVLRPRLALLPLGPDRFYIQVGVTCVTSGIDLGGVPVQLMRYLTLTDDAPVETFQIKTGADGFATFRGLAGGWFGFRVNDNAFAAPRPGWHPLVNGVVSGQHLFISKAHRANVQLKPEKQDFTVTVRGFDPVLNLDNQPLKDFAVEVTGLNPDDTNRVVMPTQTSVTDLNGRAVFSGLPSIPLHVIAKRIGYKPGSTVAFPNPVSGVLPAATVTPVLEATHLFVLLRHPYAHSNFTLGLPVVVEGHAGTLTEGIRRVASSYDNRFPWQRAFFNLMPGNYRVFVNGSPTGNPSATVFRPQFKGEKQVRAIEGVFTDFELPIEAVPGRVRGRLFAADQMGKIDAALPSQPFFGTAGEAPVYRQPAGVPIEIIEFAGNSYLEAPLRTNLVTTDALGTFSVDLLPTHYGIRIPSMTNHVAHVVQLRNLSTTVNAQKLITQRWPYVETWPYLSGAVNGNPLLIRSTNEYELDLFILKQVISIQGNIEQFLGNLIDHVARGGTATLQSSLGAVASQPLSESQSTVAFSGSHAGYRFTDLPPGTYTGVDLAHAKFTFDPSNASPSTTPIVFHRRPAPGVFPTTDPNFDLSPAPFSRQRFFAREVAARYIPPSTSIKVLTYRGGGGATGGYPAEPLDTFFTMYVKPDAGGFYIQSDRAANLPYGSFDYWISGRRTIAAPEFSIKGRASEGQKIEHKIYWGGGPSDTPLSEISHPGRPEIPFPLTIRVVNRLDSSSVISNAPTTATVHFDGTNVTRTISGELIEPAWIRFPFFIKATNPNWVYDSVTYEQTDRVTGAQLLIIKMRRATSVQGTVRSTEPGAAALANVRVQIRDKRGSVISEVVTDNAGVFVVAAELSSQPVFVDISAYGYKPWRTAYTDNDAVPVGLGDSLLTVDAKVEPMPPPKITETTLDRFGVFLPGLNQAGDLSNLKLESTAAATRLTWTITAQSAGPVSINLPAFETDGVPLPNYLTMSDPITELWLIDPRSYTNSARSGNPVPLVVPGEQKALRDWLARIRSGAISNLLAQPRLFSDVFPLPESDPVSGTNSLRLWELPEGEFNPVFVAVTKGGAVGVQNGYPFPSEIHKLRGVRVPPWLGSSMDGLSTLAAFPADPQRAAKTIPKGRYFIDPNRKPEFRAAITNDANGFLSYNYNLPVDWNEGMENPGGGLLDFLPGFFGVRYESGLNFGLRGTNAEVFLHAKGHDVKFDVETFFTYIPSPLIPVLNLSFHASLDASKQFTPVADPFEMQVTNSASARFGFGVIAEIDFDLERFFVTPGTAGKLKRLGFGGVEATLKGAIELGSTMQWNTRFPSARAGSGSTGTGLDQVYRRHFLGGRDEQFKAFELCLSGEASVNATAPGGTLEATFGLALQGGACASGMPSARFVINPESDWPPFNSIEAEFNLFGEFKLDLWVEEYGYRFNLPLLKVNRDFTTESIFQLIPINDVRRILSPSTAPPGMFSGTGDTRVLNFYAAGAFASESIASGQLLAYTDVDPGSGQMLLKIARREASRAWLTPVTVATAGGVVNVALTRTQAGPWLAVWTQLEATDAGNPYPASSLMFAQSADGAAWSVPAPLASLKGVAAELRLRSSGNQTALAFLETEDGPLADQFALKAATWNGTSWTVPATLFGKATVIGFELEGVRGASAPSFQLAWLGHGGTLRSLAGPLFNPAAAITIATNVTKTFDLLGEETASEPYVAVWRNTEQHIELAALENAAWHSRGVIISNALPSELRVLQRGQSWDATFLLAWTAGSPPAVNFAWVDNGGQMIHPPALLTADTALAHRDLELGSAPDGTPRLFARRQAAAGASDSLVELSIPFGTVVTGPQLRSPRLTADGRIEFFIQGNTALRYRVQVSTDLRTWSDAAVGIAPSDAIPFRDPMGSNTLRYYRAVTP